MKRMVFFVVVAMPVMADTQFRAGRMNRNDVPFGKGQCDIRLQIDKDAEVSVRGDLVSVRTLSGREARDDGSECNAPLPGPGLQEFNFEVRDDRGEIILLSAPSGRNGYAAVLRIRDHASGAGRYHFRLSWTMNGYGNGRPGSSARNPFGVQEAIQVCRAAVVSRIVDQHRYGDVDIRSIQLDDRPGRSDYVLGEADARRGMHGSSFTFVCSVDFDSGRVRSVEVRKR
jgi:hypothetical protein